MRISVVIPLYNKKPHIKRSIDSILGQTIQPFEIIVVDDGSTDGGGEIVKNYNNTKIRLVRQENLGQSAARNRGIEEACSELIGFLDADDEWLPDFLENIVVLKNNFPDCGAYVTSTYTVRPDGNIYYPDLSLLPPEPWIGIIPNFFALYQQGMAFNSSSIVIPKVIIKDIGGFPFGEQHNSDIDTWVRIAIKYPIAISPKRKAVYHQDAESRTAYTHSDLVEFPVVRTIQNVIKEGKIADGELLSEALEYIAQKQLSTAINNIMTGHTSQGIEFLNKCKYTKKYKNKWFFWRFWSIFPAFVPKMSLALLEYFRGY
jgi:glycosyltransferase involved in cell wall biosynthesis